MANSGRAGAPEEALRVFAPPSMSAELVLQQYHAELGQGTTTSHLEQKDSGRGPMSSAALSLHSPPPPTTAAANPQRQQPSACGEHLRDSDESSPCSSDGGATLTTAVTAPTVPDSPLTASGRRDRAARAAETGKGRSSGPQPMLSSPATAVVNGGGGGALASGRKPLLSGRTRQLRLQGTSLGVAPRMEDSDGSSGLSLGVVPRTSTLATPSPPPTRTTSSVLLHATTGGSFSSHHSTPSGTALGHPAAAVLQHPPRANAALCLPNSSLSRPSSASSGAASFRRRYHLSSISGCNYSTATNSGGNANGSTHAMASHSSASAPLSPALSTHSTGSKAPVSSARHTFERSPLPVRAPMPAAVDAVAAGAGLAETGGGVCNNLHPLLRREYRELQKGLLAGAADTPAAAGEGVSTVVGLPSHGRKAALAGRLPATNAPTDFQHRRKRTCPLHSKAGRAAEERRQEADRLRLLQQQRHDEQIINNGGREAIDPNMKSSAKVAGASSRLLQRARSRQGSFNGTSSMIGLSTCASRLTSPKELAGLPSEGTPQRAAVQNGFFNSPPNDAAHGGGGDISNSSLLAEESQEVPARPLTRNRFGSVSNMNRNGLKGETIVVALQRDRSSSASSSASSSPSPRLARSPSPPLVSSTTTRNRHTVFVASHGGSHPIPSAQAKPSANESTLRKHKIDYHEAPTPAPYRKKKSSGGAGFCSDSDSDSGECVFSFYKQRQNKVRRTPASSEALSPPDCDRTIVGSTDAAGVPMSKHERRPDAAVASLAAPALAASTGSRNSSTTAATTAPGVVDLTMKESASTSQSLAGSLILPARGDGAPDPHRREDANSEAAAAEEDDEECCYCCPCRRPENFFLLCQHSEQASRTVSPPGSASRLNQPSSSSTSQPFTPVGLPAHGLAGSRPHCHDSGPRSGTAVPAAAGDAGEGSRTCESVVLVEELESAVVAEGLAPVCSLHAFGGTNFSHGSSSRHTSSSDAHRRKDAEAEEEEDDEEGPLLKVASFRRSSVRKVNSR